MILTLFRVDNNSQISTSKFSTEKRRNIKSDIFKSNYNFQLFSDFQISQNNSRRNRNVGYSLTGRSSTLTILQNDDLDQVNTLDMKAFSKALERNQSAIRSIKGKSI